MTNKMDKKKMMEKLVREAHEKGLFNGTWLYAENGKIVSKGSQSEVVWNTRTK